MPEWLPFPCPRLRRLGGDKGRPFLPGMSPRSFDRRRSRHAYASAEKFSCQRREITINSGIWLEQMITPIFLHRQANQYREHHETDDASFFLGEDEHQLRRGFTCTDGKCPRTFIS